MAAKKRKKGEPETLQEYSSGKDPDHEVVGVREVDDGKFLKWAYDCDSRWDRYTVNTATPSPNKLFNFDVPMGKLGDLIVLDPYGDEIMPDDLRKVLLNEEMFHNTIGIFRKTGEIVHVGFIKETIPRIGCPEEGDPGGEDIAYSLTFWNFSHQGNYPRMFVPKAYLKRLDELKTQKRPFYISLWENSLFSFISRWSGYGDLQQNLLVDLHFYQRRLQVWNSGYREVSGWEHTDNPHDPEYGK